jgi:hypothetical protein
MVGYCCACNNPLCAPPRIMIYDHQSSYVLLNNQPTQRWSESSVYPGTERDIWIYVPAPSTDLNGDGTPGLMVFNDGSLYLDPKGLQRELCIVEICLAFCIVEMPSPNPNPNPYPYPYPNPYPNPNPNLNTDPNRKP